MQCLDCLLQLAIEAQPLRHVISHLVVFPQQALKALLNGLQPYQQTLNPKTLKRQTHTLPLNQDRVKVLSCARTKGRKPCGHSRKVLTQNHTHATASAAHQLVTRHQSQLLISLLLLTLIVCFNAQGTNRQNTTQNCIQALIATNLWLMITAQVCRARMQCHARAPGGKYFQ